MSSGLMRNLITLLVESQYVHLDPKLVPQQLRGGYRGNKFKAMVSASPVDIPIDAGLYSGGTRETYHIVRLADGKAMPALNHGAAPFSGERRQQEVPMEPGFVVVRHSMFMGKDTGLTFYVHPDDATRLLPAADEGVTDIERKVLNIIGGIKPAYRDNERQRSGITRADYEAAMETLRAKGMLNKAGAITIAGRNARSSAGQSS